MSDEDSIVRISLAIDDRHFRLSPTVDVRALKTRIEEATKTSGSFVDFEVAEGDKVSALIGAPCRVFLSESHATTATPVLGHAPAGLGDEFEL